MNKVFDSVQGMAGTWRRSWSRSPLVAEEKMSPYFTVESKNSLLYKR